MALHTLAAHGTGQLAVWHHASSRRSSAVQPGNRHTENRVATNDRHWPLASAHCPLTKDNPFLIAQAITALHEDEEFQADAARPEVRAGIEAIRKDTSLYDSYARQSGPRVAVAWFGCLRRA